MKDPVGDNSVETASARADTMDPKREGKPADEASAAAGTFVQALAADGEHVADGRFTIDNELARWASMENSGFVRLLSVWRLGHGWL